MINPQSVPQRTACCQINEPLTWNPSILLKQAFLLISYFLQPFLGVRGVLLVWQLIYLFICFQLHLNRPKQDACHTPVSATSAVLVMRLLESRKLMMILGQWKNVWSNILKLDFYFGFVLFWNSRAQGGKIFKRKGIDDNKKK